MVGNMASNFLDLVLIGERIEEGMRTWKIGLGWKNQLNNPNSRSPNADSTNWLDLAKKKKKEEEEESRVLTKKSLMLCGLNPFQINCNAPFQTDKGNKGNL
ncbi:hypothetical protein CR513_05929, partial [Mucuna pruriens]